MRLNFEMQNSLAQLVALCGQSGRINQHTVAFNSVQSFRAGYFELVDKAQAALGLQLRPQNLVHGQGLVGVFAGIFGRLGHVHLGKGNLVGTFAAQVFVVNAFAPQVAFGQAGQTMGAVHFQHIALQHGVVHIALHLNAVVGKYMAVVLDVLAQLAVGGVFQPRFQASQHLVPRQLQRRIRAAVHQGHISSMVRLHTP